MPRKRGKDNLKKLGPKTDEAAATNAPPPAIKSNQKMSRGEKVRSSDIAKQTPYGSERDRRRTS